MSGALNAAGTVRGRFTAAAQKGDSYLDRYSLEKHLFSGIVDIDLAAGSTLTLGHSEQHNRPNGVMWGALPMFYSDGTPTRLRHLGQLRAELDVLGHRRHADLCRADTATGRRLAGQGRAHAARAGVGRRAVLRDRPARRATGAGLTSWPSKYGHKETQWIADASVTGPFTLGGRRHELVLGANWGKSEQRPAFERRRWVRPLTESDMLNGNAPRPAFDTGITGSADFDNRRTTLYAVSRFNATDALKLVTGANVTRSSSSGMQYGVCTTTARPRRRPMSAPPWRSTAATRCMRATAASTTRSTRPTRPATCWSRSRQQHRAGREGRVDGRPAQRLVRGVPRASRTTRPRRPASRNGRTYYRGVDATSTGFELDVAGTLAPGWELNGGYTQLRIEGPDGSAVRTYVPRKTLRLTTSYSVPALTALKLGASLKWQSDYERTDGAVITRQPAYALLDLAATYEFTPQLQRHRQARERHRQALPEQPHVAEPDLLRSTAQRGARAQMDVLKSPHALGDLVHDAYLRAMETVGAQAALMQPLAYTPRRAPAFHVHCVVELLPVAALSSHAMRCRMPSTNSRHARRVAGCEHQPVGPVAIAATELGVEESSSCPWPLRLHARSSMLGSSCTRPRSSSRRSSSVSYSALMSCR